MVCDWRPFTEFVSRPQRFLLTTHVRPDGDALGSILAMGGALRQIGKQVRLVISSRMPPRYAFMDPQHEIKVFGQPGDEFRDTEALLILDTGTFNQLESMADFVRSLPAPKVVIDHHLTQDDLGALRFVDTSAEANARLVHEAIGALGVPLNPAIASALYVGLAMDTGWFGHSNTTPATLALAAELAQAGAKSHELKRQLFDQNTLARLKLEGRALDRLAVTAGGRVAYMSVRRADMESTGAVPTDSEDLVNITLSIAGVEVGLFFFEQIKGNVKVSFRSRDGIDVRKLAEEFGGGGHRQAAGAILPGPFEEAQARVLQAVTKAVQER